ncbi:MAG: helix-turn-helix transcriptional regulator [Clostridia bacterium]|nr:helix-turn-helix transcriptional regulator [Clostridia bacterium]
MDDFAIRLKELRTEIGLSIQELSRQVGIGSSSLCRWENRQADVKGSQLVVLSKFFSVSTDYLLGLEQ